MFPLGSGFADMMDMGPQAAMPTLSGDYYHEGDNVTRGLSLYCGAGDFGYADHCASLEGQGFFQQKAFTGPEETSRGAQTGEHLPISRFQECDEASEVPQDTFFQLEQTLIKVDGGLASQIGNRVIDLLGAKGVGSISKVNRVKFTINAEICLDGLSCLIKVRIYRQSSGTYLVEMQRRSGDSIAFHRVHRWASHDLNSGADLELPTFDSCPEQAQHVFADASIAPLLDLAQTGNAQLQAEAVQGLLQAATNVHLALQLCSPQAFALFRGLLEVVCFSVAEPLARMLCCLASLPEARNMFTDPDFLQTMIEKVPATGMGHPGSQFLAEALHHGITQHAAELSLEATRQVSMVLTQKMLDLAPECHRETAFHLQESRERLTLVMPPQNEPAWCF